MADKHPYISGTGGITGAINQFKKAFPTKVNAETLKKLGIASNNESYLINILRFIAAIDSEGNRTTKAAAAFAKHDLGEFQQAFGDMIKSAYSDLFALHGEDAWTLGSDKLISFFRGSDQTSDLVGRRQATTFQALASFAGHGEVTSPKASAAPRSVAEKGGKIRAPKSKEKEKSSTVLLPPKKDPPPASGRDFGLTVRIEVNLPPAGDQDTYDRIFKSIRENLIDAK